MTNTSLIRSRMSLICSVTIASAIKQDEAFARRSRLVPSCSQNFQSTGCCSAARLDSKLPKDFKDMLLCGRFADAMDLGNVCSHSRDGGTSSSQTASGLFSKSTRSASSGTFGVIKRHYWTVGPSGCFTFLGRKRCFCVRSFCDIGNLKRRERRAPASGLWRLDSPLEFSFVSAEGMGLNATMIDWLWSNNKFLGIEWHFWKLIGWLGNAAFFARFMVQWFASEKRKRVVVPVSFWWLSLCGSFCLLTYALFYQKDSVFIFAYAFTWIPYIRNLMLQKRTALGSQTQCAFCSEASSANAKFCWNCGSALPARAEGRSELVGK